MSKKNHKSIKQIRAFDIVIIAFLLGLSFVIIPFFKKAKSENVVIYRGNKVVATYPLSIRKDVIVNGNVGGLVVRIEDQSVRVISSRCKNKICVHQGSIHHSSQSITCAPNHIIITIRGHDQKDPLDGIAR